MEKELLYEEIERIRLLFGESLLYGNLNDNFNLITEQGRYFKKVWDDFAIKNPTAAKKFDDVSINRFKNTDIKSFDDFFKHLEINKSMWEAIGIPSLDLTTTIKLKKLIMDGNDPSLLFRKSGSNRYFYEFIPVDGNIRGEFFYWFSKKYPDEWLKGLKSIELDDVADTKLTNVNALGGEKISVDPNVKPVDETLPAVKMEVRVDSEGRCLDFDSNGKALSTDGKLIDFDVATGKPKGDYLPKIDDGGRINVEPPPRPYTPDPEGARRFIGDMEGRNWDGRARRAAAKNYFAYYLDRWMPKVYEFFKTFLMRKNYETARRRFNDLIFEELRNVYQNDGITAANNSNRIRAAINDAFINFYRTLDGDPDFDDLNFQGVWAKMLDEFDNTTQGLLPNERGKLKSYLEEIKSSVEADALFDGVITPSGRPNIFEYTERIKISEKSTLAGWSDSLADFYKKCVVDIIPTITNPNGNIVITLTNIFTRVLQAIIRPAFNVFLRGSIFNPKAMRLFLSTESRFLGIRLKPFSKGKYIALITRTIVFNKLLYPLMMSIYYAAQGITYKTLEMETGVESSKLGKGEGFISTFIDQFGNRMVDEFRASSRGSVVDNIVQWIPGYWDDLGLYLYRAERYGDTSKEAKTINDYTEEGKKKAEEMGVDPNKVDELAENGEFIVQKETERVKLSIEEQKINKESIRYWPKRSYDDGKISEDDRKKYLPLVNTISDNLKKNDKIIKSMSEANAETLNTNPYFIMDGKRYYVRRQKVTAPKILTPDNVEMDLYNFLDTYKSTIEKNFPIKPIAENFQILNNKLKQKLLMENIPRTKFGEDNFKHWKDTFVFKSEDEKNPGQFKQVKINMEDVMDRINHYRKKYDEDDAFVRAVLDTHDNVVKVMYTKDLADISESARPRGLALLLRENRGELEIFSVSRPANGNWFLVKGDYTPSQLANMDLEKKEPEDKEPKKLSKTEDDLKKKEEESITLLKRNEKEGLVDLPRKVKQKLKEKISKGWTTEEPPSYLMDFYTTSEVNSVFNDPIEIFKLDPSPSYFATVVKNSARVTPKRGFCRSLYMASRNEELNERQRKTISHILTRCKVKLAGKFGVASF